MFKSMTIPDKLLIILFVSIFMGGIFSPISMDAQVIQDADSAFQMAGNEGKAVLLLFTGSDWCPHCQRLEKNILNQSEFITFAEENLILLVADFPQRGKQSKNLVRQNEELAEKYNPGGSFPTLILFNEDKTKHKTIHFTNQKPAEFVRMVDEAINTFETDE